MNYWLMTFHYWFPKILLEGFLRYFLIALGIYLLFWVVGAQKVRHRLIQGEWPDKKHVRREIGYSMVTVLIVALVGLVIFGGGPGIFKVYTSFSQYGWFYFFFSLVWIVLAHDAYFYWTHRLMHLRPFFRLFHHFHHLSLNPSPWAAYAFSPWEAALHAAFLPLYLMVFPTHTIVILVFLYHMVFRNVMHHMGIELFPRGFTVHSFWGWVATTTHHSLHHMHQGSNYGFYFTFWDRVMKTLDRDYDSFYEKVTRSPLWGAGGQEGKGNS
jgi:lathosterol oxidase